MSDEAFSDRHLLVFEPGRAERHYWRDVAVRYNLRQ
jgi:hypothetical protein